MECPQPTASKDVTTDEYDKTNFSQPLTNFQESELGNRNKFVVIYFTDICKQIFLSKIYHAIEINHFSL